MNQSLSLLIFFSGILSASVHSTIAQDFVVVTSGNGYLLDTDNQVAKKVPFMTVLDVEASRTPYFLVDGGLKIHRDQVHHSASFDYMKENLPGARQALQTLSECFRDGIESDEAIETANRAIDQIKAAFSAQTPATAWFLQTLAALQSDQGDLEAANETLDAADTLLKEIGQVRHVQAFDVFNMRGLLKSQEGDVLEAIRLFNEALLITSADLGSTHLDAATILTNMSVSYEAIGETAQAVRAQLLATRIRDQVLPPKAIEVPDTYARLGSLKSADGQYQNAIADFKLAAELYRGHSDQAANVITMLLQIGDAYELLKDYEAAELSYIAGNGELNQLDETDALAWRKAIIIRQALLDHGRGDDSEALSHLRAAEDLYDQESPQNEDGQTFENTGNIYASQRDNASAKKYFVKALKIYAETDGETSEAVLQIDELIADLDGARDGSLDDVVMTSDLNAYMFDGEGNFLTAVPPLTVLSWNAYTDETDERYGFYTSPYGDHFGNIDQTQLRRARMLPGYFEASAELFRSVVKAVADSQSALRTGDTETAKSLLADAIKQCLADVGEKCTLTLWVRMFEVRLLAETEGVEAAADALSALKEVIANRPKGDYPIEMDAQSVAGTLLLKMGEPEAAAEKFRTARDIAIERLGTNHIDVLELNRLIAKA
ncbi:MAG: tetratricopeptide repeat protein [Planctomycetaceae bacterium]|nr:tetratricopeptide repeat protein [Planctomycetaceae bacterium]